MRSIIFAYPTNRSKLETEVKNELSPDNALYGLNHLKKLGDKAYFKDVSPILEKTLDLIFWPLIKLFISQIDIDFKLSRALFLLPHLNKSDLIIVNTDSVGLAVCFLKRLKIIKKPVIYAVGLFYIKGGLEKAIQKNRKSLFYYFYRWILSGADQILYHAPIEKEKLVKLGLFDPARCSFVPMGSDAHFFKLKKFSKIKTLANTVVSVGKDRARDYKTLFDAACALPAVSFIVVCRKLNIRGLDVPKNVKVYFDLPYLEVAKLYYQAQVVVIPNREMKRSSGQMTLTDCFQCKKPIILTNITGLAHYPLKDHFNVLQVSPQNPKDLKEAITKLLSDRELSARLIKNCQILAKEYTTYSYAQKLNEIVDFLFAEVGILAIGENDLEFTRNLRNKNKDAFFSKGYIKKEDQKKWYDSYLSKNNDYTFVIKKGNQKIGVGAIYNIDESKKTAEIGRFIIDQKYRNKGYGSLLIEKLEYIANKRLGLKSLSLEVFADNKSAIGLYEKSGFKKQRPFSVKGETAISMIKNLTSL